MYYSYAPVYACLRCERDAGVEKEMVLVAGKILSRVYAKLFLLVCNNFFYSVSVVCSKIRIQCGWASMQIGYLESTPRGLQLLLMLINWIWGSGCICGCL